MKPIPTLEELPTKCIEDGSEEVWWWNSHDDCWMLGIAMFMDFDEQSTYEKYTHWLPSSELPIPGETC